MDKPRLLMLVRCVWRDKWLIVAALLFLLQSRLKLSLRGFGDLRQLRHVKTGNDGASPALSSRIAFSIDVARHVIPGATCLVRAMAGQRLLALKGCSSEIKVGVRRGDQAGLEAHAWLMSGDLLVLGGVPALLSTYTPLPEAR